MPSDNAKRRQGWEASPPLCRNCDHFLNGGAYQQVKPRASKHPASRCALGNFNTSAFAICDRWTEKGETLLKDPRQLDLSLPL